MRSSLTYTPSPCPIDISTIMQHTRLYSAPDQNLIAMYAQVATEMVENYLGRFLINRQVTWTVSEHSHRLVSEYNDDMLPWPWTTIIQHPVLMLPRPASAIASVTIGIWGADDVTMIEGTDYETDLATEPARIRWISNAYRQTCKDHLQVVFTSGYGTTLADIPTSIQHAILVLVTQLTERRGDEMPDVMPNSVLNLIQNYRFFSFGN